MRKAAVAFGIAGAVLALALPLVVSVWARGRGWDAAMSPGAYGTVTFFSILGFFLGMAELLIIAVVVGINGISGLSGARVRPPWSIALYAAAALIDVALPSLAGSNSVGGWWVFALTLPTLCFAVGAVLHGLSCWGVFRVPELDI